MFSACSQTHIAWDEFREGVGIVSKHPVIEEGFHSLPRGVFLRKVVWNHVDSPIGLVNIFSTHLSYLPEHNSIRVQQVQEIIDYISQTTTIHHHHQKCDGRSL